MRVHNFGAGPCALPTEVLEEVRDELLDFAGTGMSVVELSHRSPHYEQVHRQALELARTVSAAPEDVDILFIQGGASLQFGMIPLNLLGPGERAGFVVTGSWAKAAYSDARRVGDAYAGWDGSEEGYRRMPTAGEMRVEPGTRYVHVTTNETINGTRMTQLPATTVPLVADMSSEFLARPIDWPRYDLVYGGVQKNLAPAGMALVFVRHAVVEAAAGRPLPNYLRYDWHAAADSLANTPPMFSIAVMAKMLARMAARGGIEALERESAAKAARVYDEIDISDGFYRSPVAIGSRSHMNVVFRLPDEALESTFVEEAERRALVGLKGHRSVGGIRASLYAGVSAESVDALVAFMSDFRRSH